MDLSLYQKKFDQQYGEYAENYKIVKAHTNRLNTRGLLQELTSVEFRRFATLLEPLVWIKNYKTQSPFPVDVVSVLRCIIELKRSSIPAARLSKEPERLFLEILRKQGFGLPTVSALFHFCHPNRYPIVDRNVEAACNVLKRQHATDFEDLDAPKLPDAKLPETMKLARYRSFITFIDRIKNLQKQQHGGRPSYRFIDKALMVLGAEELKRRARRQRLAAHSGR